MVLSPEERKMVQTLTASTKGLLEQSASLGMMQKPLSMLGFSVQASRKLQRSLDALLTRLEWLSRHSSQDTPASFTSKSKSYRRTLSEGTLKALMEDLCPFEGRTSVHDPISLSEDTSKMANRS